MNWKQALSLGLCSVGAYVKQDATMFNYNGVVLPKLPEWDREKYPYVTISNSLMSCWLLFATAPTEAYYQDGHTEYSYRFPTSVSWVQYSCPFGGTEWSYSDTTDKPEGLAMALTPWWANYDVLDENGSVALAASDPVPVYE